MSNQQDRGNLDDRDAAIFNAREEECARPRNLTGPIKSGCTRCCAFSYQNYTQITVAISLTFVFLVGILKIVLGSMSISSGQAAIILASQDHLHWSGIFLLIVGFSSIICGIASFRSIVVKSWKNMTAKQIYAVVFIMLYIILFDVISVIMASRYNDDNFSIKVELHMSDTLKNKYGVSAESFEETWNHLQRDSKCCGARVYSEWFASAWADEINTTIQSNAFPLPLSCHYENVPFGPCFALSGAPQQPPTEYLLLVDYEIVYTCNPFLVFNGTVNYIYPRPCSSIYTTKLREEMRATMGIGIGITATDFTAVITLLSVAIKLPFQQRVHVYNHADGRN